ncbi:two-component sensor histidine kinase [Devosia nitrariae]|uniref:histidine kinase n=2 Tax=Devosia nitrariae TaxID=2071872 RepID=A0ABQ5VZE0_9HYPH|nr:two-component sensor histidine kinase [Devosia nitrariae]
MDAPQSETTNLVAALQVVRRAGLRVGLLAAAFLALAVLVWVETLPLIIAAFIFLAAAFVAAALPFRSEVSQSAILSGARGGEPDIFAFADALADPCLILDRRAVVVHRNPSAARQFPATASGNPITFSLRNPDFVRAIERAGETATTQTIELHETVPSETWTKVVVAPLRTPGRGWVGDDGRRLVVTFQSLTELKRVDAMRTDFIANASHELRTPLASLLGFIETLQGPAAKDAAVREKFLGIMRGQAERMAKLIEDLLSLSRIEMHQHMRPTGEIDLVLLLRQVCEGLQTHARDASVEIALDIEAETAILTGDREQLYEVFENLIDNAVKYGASGGKVEVSLALASRPGYAHLVTVTDFGPGVAEEHVPRLTERFYRVDAESSRKKKGTGLGLAIVKHIITRHRGLMTIRSRPGEGMRIEVLLPR